MMQARKLAQKLAKLAHLSWWLLGEEDLSQRVTCHAAERPRASSVPMML